MTELSSTERMPEVIAEALISEIREGEIPVGGALPTERQLCERFDTSRPTIREALALMQMRGFLDSGGGRRPKAARPSLQTILHSAADHIRDLLGGTESGAHLEQMRQFIETGAAREAAMRGDRAQIARLQEALIRNEAAIGTSQFAATDIAFHRVLVSIVGNPVMLTLHDMFVSELLAQRPAVDDPARHDAMAFDEHTAIYDAVLNGDVMMATDVMDRHLARSYRARLKNPKRRNGPQDH
ncbi:FCD domain-containing protein [Qingshengfaniella alkalisoli]|uniref:FCD domain-containing protein n=1 Tax=Qingshengfaniella alkalisoli TaxID=2599296 RepID=A0A5B8J0N5_9RHOB|nr:FCD domain-containing protein [Qingshengfaniella alkalisoli]QDY70438.1 FCD domain-containing protein [Qingshengfaniella alkalisoli]